MEDREEVLQKRLQDWRKLWMVEEDLADDDFFNLQIIMPNKNKPTGSRPFSH
ncbi:hypothetical protein PAXRUDRAFT_21328 [Paxillus rubicundulus Ve08.2h10]|uniref:Uncharacterized protein n=1 Tax=Paxillus rubicundulus Ve08.2h10 TaxID=930991 RepID=A0A0D0CQD6_9AGAM|nr:hypothetical protein PAXRUDRAFT_21328 [Paxillus rubicundulus Ve08.2h10]